MLIDLTYLWENIGTVLALLFVVTILKTSLNLGILQLIGERWDSAFKTSLFLGQIGEFSFVLAAAAATAGVFGDEANRLAIAVIALSLMTSPLWYLTAHRFHDMTISGINNARTAINSMYQDEIDAVEMAARLSKESLKSAVSTAKSASDYVWHRTKPRHDPKTAPPDTGQAKKTDQERAKGDDGSS